MAPSLPDLTVKYGITNPTVTALTLSIFLLSFAIGPLLAAPLTEVYGRVWVRHPLIQDQWNRLSESIQGPSPSKPFLPCVQPRLCFCTQHYIFPHISVSGYVMELLLCHKFAYFLQSWFRRERTRRMRRRRR